MDFAVTTGDWPEGLEAIAEKAIGQALAQAEISVHGPLEVSILLTNDAAQQEINKRWRGKDSATNVLSFPQFEPFSPLSGLLGDISLAYETVNTEAKKLDKSLEDHFIHLVIHGTLHLIGYDHETDADALVMEMLETEILSNMGVADPYA